MTLEIITVLNKRGRNINGGKLTVTADSTKIYNGITSVIIKISNQANGVI